MQWLGIGSNIMSLGGIAIAIGAMVDAAIVMVENAHKRLERMTPEQSRSEVIIKAAEEVGPALFFSLLVITVSFLPIFALEAQEGRLFKPLAYTKSFAMAAAAVPVDYPGACTDDPVHSRPHRPRGAKSAESPADLALPTGHRLVLRAKTLTILVAIAVLGCDLYSGDAARQRVHAQPQ